MSILSSTIILLGLISLLTKGVHYGIDFTGGTLIQVRFEQAPTVDRVRAALGKVGLGDSIIQQFGEPREYILRMPLTAVSAEEVSRKVRDALGAEAAVGKAEIRRVEFVGPQVGRELQLQAIYWNGNVAGVNLPQYVEADVDKVGAGSKSDMASGKTLKDATLTNGVTLKVPLFVDAGERILVDPRERTFVRRAQK